MGGLLMPLANIPLIRINSLSEGTGCEILGKCEFLNPGGSVKDRVAVKIIEEALESGELAQGGKLLLRGALGAPLSALLQMLLPMEVNAMLLSLMMLLSRRLTQNFGMAKLDGASRGTDLEVVEMSRFLLKNDGLFVGSSSAMNCVGVVRVAKSVGPVHTIVTILCDSGMGHLSKFYNDEYLSQHGLTPKATGLEFLGIQ